MWLAVAKRVDGKNGKACEANHERQDFVVCGPCAFVFGDGVQKAECSSTNHCDCSAGLFESRRHEFPPVLTSLCSREQVDAKTRTEKSNCNPKASFWTIGSCIHCSKFVSDAIRPKERNEDTQSFGDRAHVSSNHNVKEQSLLVPLWHEAISLQRDCSKKEPLTQGIE